MNATEARVATLNALIDFHGRKGPLCDAFRAEIAAIEAEAMGGAYVPKVGDVVAGTWSNKPDSYGATLYRLASPPGDGPHWTCVRVDGRERVRECYIAADNFRPATPSERIAAGLDKAPTEARQACPMCNKPLGVKSATDATPYQRMLDSLTCECGEHDDDSPAPPPARPKRVRVTGNIPYPSNRGTLVDGTILNVKKWSDEGTPRPIATWPDGFDRYLHEGEWVPADEPEGEEAFAAKVRAWYESSPLFADALARAKVKS